MAIVKIAHAVSDENRKASGGNPGDQTGREVCIWDWYNKPWTHVIRAKKNKHAEKIAKTAKAITENEKVGYNQIRRTTLFEVASKYKFKIDKIDIPCDTDCSAKVSVCVNAAGIKVSKDMYTGNEFATLVSTDMFNYFTSPRYTAKTLWLKRGDILLGKGHTAIVLNDGAVFTRNLKVGDYGLDVKALQEALNDIGYNCGNVDGDFGGKTRAAVEAYQNDHGLKPDCVAGKKTISKLGFAFKKG